MERGGAEAVLVNCAPPPDATRALATLKRSCSLPLGAFAHIRRFSPPSWEFEFFPQFTDSEEWPPACYAPEANRWREQGAPFLGGYSGRGPAHIGALHA